MHRFIVAPAASKSDIVTFDKDDSKHIIKVLRHKKGDIVFAFDGNGMQYEVELSFVDNDKISGKILKAFDPGTEPKTNVILFQAVPKTDKMDWIVQKTVELGVSKIVPMFTEFSVINIKEKSIDSRIERWNRISREACKQSGRVVVPEVTAPVPYEMVLKQWKDISGGNLNNSSLAVFCYEKEGKKCLKDLLKCYNISCINTIGVFIGPEGGFSLNELQLATDCLITPVSLGKRILRAETASIAVLSAIMYEMDEWCL